MRVLLDTCAIIWSVSDPDALSSQARETLAARGTEVFVSPLSCAELACLSNRGRIGLDRHWKTWFRHYIALNGWKPIGIDLAIVEEAYSLPEPFHADPVDRVLVATSRLKSLHVITADRKILDYPHVETVW
ncbi:MAG: type II toxin-antitoxin system VapC family toxin [Kiritimatiellae bacterium]|nr:type II toxin-antitoxin system VapC family toxin [Kiritimatiellia bacterium]